MIRVRIGESERELRDATPQWIQEQLNRRRADGISICVQVLIDSHQVNLALSTPNCLRNVGGSGGRPLNSHESNTVSMWEKLHLNTQEFTGGNLIAFLKQIS